jgi:predicted nucleic acid-binding protein
LTAHQRLAAAQRVFLDTAPVIYFVQGHPAYLPVISALFDRFDGGDCVAVISPVTLAECLVLPLRRGDVALAAAFEGRLNQGAAEMVPIYPTVARHAAELRATHGFSLNDAFQLACAVAAGCDLFLTNDATLRRVPAPAVVTLDELLQEAAG